MTSLPQTIAHTLIAATNFLAASGMQTARLDAEVLLAYTLGLDRAGLYVRLHDHLPEAHVKRFQEFVQRRCRHEPVPYITGVQEFWSLEFHVTQDVLIPRPETELLVETSLRLLAQTANHKPQPPLSLLDIGTGSGCIAIALAKELPQAEVWATDISSAALAIAQDNAQRHGVAKRIHFLQGDLFSPLVGQNHRFAIIVTNPPYIARSELAGLQPEVRDWEPRQALDGGPEGLDYYRRLLNDGPSYLSPGGWLVMEIGHAQGAAVLRLARQCQELSNSSCVRDYAGRERLITVQKP